MRDTMPVGEPGYHEINAGPHLLVLFNPDRSRPHEPPGIKRPSIVVAVAGQAEQSIRLDPFDVDPHYHVNPVGGLGQIRLEVGEGSTPLDSALAFFELEKFLDLLDDADEGETANKIWNDLIPVEEGEVKDDYLAAAAAQIRQIAAAA